MVPLLKKRIPDERALELRPDDLPPIEPELSVDSPRPFVWAARTFSFGAISDEMRTLLVRGQATRAWVTHYASQRDSEGTDHLVQFAFEVDGGCLHGSCLRGFDDYHLSVGSRDYAQWLYAAFRPGGTFTVLHEGSGEPTIYGNMQLYIEEDLVGLATKLRLEPGSEELAEQFMTMVISPSALPFDERDEYITLVERLGIQRSLDGSARARNLEHVRSTIGDGSHDEEVVARLAELCRSFSPGIWAAT